MSDVSLLDINEVVDFNEIEKEIKEQIKTIRKRYNTVDDKSMNALGDKMVNDLVRATKYKYGFNFVATRLLDVATERDEWKLKYETAKNYAVDHGAYIKEIDAAISSISNLNTCSKDKASRLRSVLFEKTPMNKIVNDMNKIDNLKK